MEANLIYVIWLAELLPQLVCTLKQRDVVKAALPTSKGVGSQVRTFPVEVNIPSNIQ